jgi:ubiquinone/menaquinone biosynthesis C-methylase UbiE
MFTPSDLIYHATIPILDAECIAEVVRRMKLYQVVAPCIGDLEPVGYNDLKTCGALLDLACGEGTWALDVAFEYPHIEVAGIDYSRVMVDTANATACAQLLTNASFSAANLRELPLDFSDASFDLIVGRFLLSFLEEANWPPLLTECRRLLKPGGVIRLTECIYGKTTSAACEHLSWCYVQALARAGLRTTPAGLAHDLGKVFPLVDLLADTGYQAIKQQDFLLDFSAGSGVYTLMYQIIPVFFELIRPFVLQMQVVTKTEYMRLCQEVTDELYADSFAGNFHLRTFWGRKAEAQGDPMPAGAASGSTWAGGKQ